MAYSSEKFRESAGISLPSSSNGSAAGSGTQSGAGSVSDRFRESMGISIQREPAVTFNNSAMNWLKSASKTATKLSDFNSSMKGGWTSDAFGGNRRNFEKLLDQYDAVTDGMDDKQKSAFDKQYSYLKGLYDHTAEVDNAMKGHTALTWDMARTNFAGSFDDYDPSKFGYTDESAVKTRRELLQKSQKAMEDMKPGIDEAKKRYDDVKYRYDQWAAGGGMVGDDPTAEFQAARQEYQGKLAEYERLEQLNRAYENSGMQRSDNNWQIRQSDSFKNTDTTYRGSNDKAIGTTITDKLGLWMNSTEDERNLSGYGSRDKQTQHDGGDSWADVVYQAKANDWDKLKEDEIRMYYWLMQNNGQEAAYSYLDSMGKTLNYRRAQDEQAELEQQYGEMSTVEKAILALKSSPMQVIGNVSSAVTAASQLARDGQVNEFSHGFDLTTSANNTRNLQTKEMQQWAEDWGAKTFGEKTGKEIGAAAGNTYQAVMSGLDSILGGTMFGNVYTPIMSAGAFATKAAELSKAGVPTKDIWKLAVGAAAIEAITEAGMIDKFSEFMTNGAKFGKAFLQQSLGESLEEGASDVLNMVWDAMVRGDNSELNQNIRALMAQGASYDDARNQAVKDAWTDTLWSMYGGFVSGGVMIGGGQAIKSGAMNALRAGVNTVMDTKAGRNVNTSGGVDTLRDQVQNLTDTKAQKRIGRELDALQQHPSRSNQHQNTRTGRAARHIEQQAAKELGAAREQAFRKEAKQYLKDQGNAIVSHNYALDVLTKVFNGEELTRGENLYFRSIDGQARMDAIMERAGGEEAFNSGVRDTQMQAAKVMSSTNQLRGGRSISELRNTYEHTDDGQPIQKSTGDAVALSGIARVDNGRMYMMTDNGEVDAADISYSNAGEALLYHTIATVAANTQEAKTLLAEFGDQDLSAEGYANAIRDAYTKGFLNSGLDKMKSYASAMKLSDQLRSKVYDMGLQHRGEFYSNQQLQDGTHKRAKNTLVYQDEAIRTMPKTKQQQATIDAAEVLVECGFSVGIFATTAENRSQYPNGKFYKDGTIWVDINAGGSGQGIGVFTMSHELTHAMKEFAPEQFRTLAELVFNEADVNTEAIIDHKLADLNNDESYKGKSDQELYDIAFEEAVAEAMESVLGKTDALNRIAEQVAQKDPDLKTKIVNWVKDVLNRIHQALKGMNPESAVGRQLQELVTTNQKILDAFVNAGVAAAQNINSLTEANGVTTLDADRSAAPSDIRESTRYNKDYMNNATQFNEKRGDNAFVSNAVLKRAGEVREAIEAILTNPEIQEALGMPPDITGKTFFADSSYGGTEENTTICPRSMGAEALLDAVSDLIGRPLTVDEQIVVSQEMQGLTKNPECVYCYVATDRKAYREYLGEYIKQRDSVIQKYRAGNTDTSRSGSLYQEFLNGRKDTENMYSRFKLWINVQDKGATQLKASDLTSIERLTELVESKYKGMDDLLKQQYVDAMKYAQSASWAKKREGYRAYNGHILKWKQARINSLNSHYGLRMYSFSDFSPAFILENMQMITDAAVRGLKMLAYTKDMNFVKIFAKTGMNINVSCFGWETNGTVLENNLQGAAWAEAQQLRAENPNVGVVFVAYNDTMVEWAMNQDWVDVVTPYHLVRTGTKVAEAFGFTNYTDISGDKKITSEWVADQDVKSVTPVMHQNNKDMYLAACKANHLTPRFEKWIDHPGYMKLVNETRRSAAETPAVQPVFDQRAAEIALQDMQNEGGYYSPVYEMADHAMEIAEKLQAGKLDGGLSEESRHSDRIMEEDSSDDIARSKRSVYNSFNTNAMQWANSTYTKQGDTRIFYNSRNNRWDLVVADEDADGGFRSVYYGNYDDVRGYYEQYREADEIISGAAKSIEDTYGGSSSNNIRNGERESDAGGGETIGIQGEQSDTNGSQKDLRRNIGEALKSRRMSPETKAAIDAYKAQSDAESKAMKAVYEAERAQIIQSYKKKLKDLQSSYSEEITNIQNAFFSIASQYESRTMEAGAKGQMIDELTEALNQEVDAHDFDNELWQKEFDRLRKEYEKSDSNVAALTEKVQAQRDAAKAKVESAHKTEMRHKIQNTVNTLNRMLLNPTRDSHVPDSMQSSVTLAMQAINGVMMSSKAANNAAQIAAKYELLDKLYKQFRDPKVPVEQANKILNKIHDIEAQIERLSQRDANMKQALGKLQEEYHKLQELDDGIYDETVDDLIQYASSIIGETNYKDLNMFQLETVYEAYTAILARIRKANKAFKEGSKMRISDMQEKFRTEMKARKSKSKLTTKTRQAISQFFWNNLKPVYTFDRIGSSVLSSLYDELRKGEDTWYRDVSDARAFFLATAAKYEYDSWDFDRLYDFESSTGEKFQLNLEEIMSLYAYSRRDQARDHLIKGGIVLNENTERTSRGLLGFQQEMVYNDSNAYQLTDATLDKIHDTLTPMQRAFAADMQHYLSEVMGAKGNEVSLQLYDIKLYKEQYYWPLKSSQKYSERAKAQQQNPGNKVKNSGFTKATVQHASNPVELSGFMQTWSAHVNQMSMYHSFTLPMEDFYRVYNWRSGWVEGAKSQSTQSILEDVCGAGAVKYIDQFLQDLNGGLRSDPRETVGKAMMSKFKKGAVFASASVAIQQPSAIGRAFAIISPAYFVGSRVEVDNSWEQLKKYAAVAGLKEMGRFDMDMGKSTEEYIMGGKGTIGEKIDEVLGYAPEKADQITWCAIWEAAKRQTAARYGLKGEALLTKAGELFTECITRTQVYDSVFSRSSNMRSKSGLMSMVTAFMAEPTTSINMMENAVRQWTRGDRRGASRAAASVLTSVVLNSLLAAFVYAARDNDEDKTYWEKYLGEFTSGMTSSSNPITYIPYAKDVWSLFQGYDVERADMSLYSDAASALTRIINVASSYNDDFDEEHQQKWNKDLMEACWKSVDAVTAFFGLPVKNIRRDINAVINVYQGAQKDPALREMSGNTIWNSIKDSFVDEIPVLNKLPKDTTADRLYDAMTSGDEVYIRRQKAKYADDQKLDAGISTALRNNDPRIREAAEAMVDGNNKRRIEISREIVAEGNFTQNQVVKAVNAEISKIQSAMKDDKNWRETEQSMYVVDDYIKAVTRDLGSADAMQREIERAKVVNKMAAGEKDKKKAQEAANTSFTNSVRAEVKKQYDDGSLSAAEAAKVLIKAGVYDPDYARKKVTVWKVLQDTGNRYDWSDSRCLQYHDIMEPAGISASIWNQFVEAAKEDIHGEDANGDGKTDSGTLMKAYLRYIDSLPLTPAQKDLILATKYTSKTALNARPWK